MDQLFAKLIAENTPKVNPLIMNGIATTYLSLTEEYIDRVIKTATVHEGLEYHGYERCTPYEEFNEVGKLRNNKRTFDLAKSDLYLVKYMFSFQGERLPDRYIYLPFVRDGAVMFLKGAKLHITPVLSDKVISPGFNSLFVRLLRYKIIFKRCYHTVIVNDVRETSNVIWSEIYRRVSDKKVPITTKASSCIVHYLLGKYGLSDMFLKYAGFKPIVGGEEINVEKYPADKWIICKSTRVKPKTFIGEYYEANNVRLAIPLEMWNHISKSLVTGFYYVADHFPTRVTPDMLDNNNIWKILLGHILFSGNYGENKLYSDICEHFTSIDDYVDNIVIEKLRESGCMAEDFYDLMAMISSEFNSYILDSNNNTLSMYGKSLEILYYVLYDITSGIFNVNFKLSKPIGNRVLTINNVKEIFNKNMRMRAIRSLASGRVAVETVSYSGDHKYFKLTSKLTEQEDLPRGGQGRKKRFVLGQDKHLDVSMIEAGSLLFLSKSNPTPTNKINPYINVDLKTGTVIPNPKFESLRRETDAKIRGKIIK